MSRSEHATRRDRRDPGDLDRKRLIKASIVEERQRPRAAPPPVPGDAVPIEVVDRGPFTRYPASPEDLRRLVDRLPPGCVDGVSRIELRLAPPDDADDDDVRPVDPFHGRARNEIVPTSRYRARIVDTVTCLLDLRQQRFAEAYARASRIVGEPRPHPDVRAVVIEAACRLGHPFDATPLPELCASLELRGYAAWAARLTALVAARSSGT